MIFLQILGVVASLVWGFQAWREVGQTGAIGIDVTLTVIAMGLISLGVWQAFAYGWIG